MRAPLMILMLLTAALLMGLLSWWNDSSAVAPDAHRPSPVEALPSGEPVAAASRITATGAVDMHDDAATAADAASQGPARHPVTIQLNAPAEWREDIPVEIVWAADPNTGRAVVSTFRTDENGSAHCQVVPFEQRPQWFAADLAFPTLGLSAVSIPSNGGEVTVPMVMPAWLDVEVVEEDGPASESVLLEIRAPNARAPGDRWHRHRLEEGHTRLMVEIGVDLEVRATTPSGRRSTLRMRAPTEPETSTPCRLELDAGSGVSIAVRTPGGDPLADHDVELLRRDRWQPIAGGTHRTDENGYLLVRLPVSFLRLAQAELLLRAERDGTAHYAELTLDLALVRDGGRVEATLLPAPTLAAGTILDPAGRGNRGTPIELQLAVANRKDRSSDGIVWQTIASTSAADDGTFAIAAFAPRSAALRLRLPEASDLDPMPIHGGAFDLRIEAPLRRTAFGRRR